MISWLNLGFNFFTKFFGDAFAPLGNANAPPMGAHLRPRGRVCVTDQTAKSNLDWHNGFFLLSYDSSNDLGG